MALVNCPECGKANVSDTAVSCPECGYNIKAHFQKIEFEKMRLQAERQAEICRKEAEEERTRKLEERIKNVPKLESPQLIAPIITIIISILIIVLAAFMESVSYLEDGYENEFFIICGLCILGYGIYLFYKRISQYKLSSNNFEEYQKQVIRKEDEAKKRSEAVASAKRRANAPKCPICGSTNIRRISTLNRGMSVATVGLASSKIGKQYECKNCKHKW